MYHAHAFFLTYRELMNSETASPGRDSRLIQSTAPWLMFNLMGKVRACLLPPSAAQNAGEPQYISRIVGLHVLPVIQCAVCLEEYDAGHGHFETQLPCMHPLCYECLQKLFPLNKQGCVCPVCRASFDGYSLHKAGDGKARLVHMTRVDGPS